VVTVDSTGGEAIESWSLRAATAWGGGGKRRDAGALFVLAVKDRKMRIELGYGLEPLVSDLQADQILARARPALRDGDYDGAIGGVLDELIGLTASGAVSAEERARLAQLEADEAARMSPATRHFLEFAGVLLAFGIIGRIAKSRRKAGHLTLMQTLILFSVLIIAVEFAFGVAGEGWHFGVAALAGSIAGNTFFLSEASVSVMYPMFLLGFGTIPAALLGGDDPTLTRFISMAAVLFVSVFFSAFSDDTAISFGSSGSSSGGARTRRDDDDDDGMFASTRRSSSSFGSSFGRSSSSSSWGSSSSSSSSRSSGYSGGGGSFGGGGASSSW
jgi:uncharacterized protein